MSTRLLLSQGFGRGVLRDPLTHALAASAKLDHASTRRVLVTRRRRSTALGRASGPLEKLAGLCLASAAMLALHLADVARSLLSRGLPRPHLVDLTALLPHPSGSGIGARGAWASAVLGNWGAPDWAPRLFPLLTGAAALVLVYLLVCRVVGRAGALLFATAVLAGAYLLAPSWGFMFGLPALVLGG